jgi:hypothetical protein
MTVPFGLVRAYHTMLPRLRAEEALLAATEVGMGTGSIEKSDANHIRSTWDRVANPRSVRQKATKVAPDAIAGLGFGIGYVGR